MARFRLAPVLALCAVILISAGCGATTPSADPENTYAAIIDVRTPEEFAAGHVQGARNIGLADPTFAEDIAALPSTGTYLVYCRSGNRSAQAAAAMEAIGLSVVDGGALEDLRRAGFRIVE